MKRTRYRLWESRLHLISWRCDKAITKRLTPVLPKILSNLDNNSRVVNFNKSRAHECSSSLIGVRVFRGSSCQYALITTALIYKWLNVLFDSLHYVIDFRPFPVGIFFSFRLAAVDNVLSLQSTGEYVVTFLWENNKVSHDTRSLDLN